jgi:autotransporter-associated beta strand protein
LTLLQDTTVYLDTPATVGNLRFGDQGNAYNWILADSWAGPLTLNAGTNMPVITVVNTNTTISATLAGTGGFLKAGAGTLTLSSDNTYTGGTVVDGGTLNLTGTPDINSKVGSGTLTVNSNGLVTVGASDMLGNQGIIGYTPSIVVNGGTINCAMNSFRFRDLTMNGGALTGDSAAGIWYSYGNVTISATATGASIVGSQLNLMNPYPPILQTFDVAAGGSGSDLTINATLARGTRTYIGTYTNVVKTGNGIMTLMAANNSLVGNTLIVSNGTLAVNGSLESTPVYVAPAGKLAGNGLISSRVVIDGTLAAGSNGLGPLRINNTLTLNPGSTTTLAIDRTAGTANYGNVQGITSGSLGGTLTVTNLGGTFQNGDTFRLFSASAATGDFAIKHLPALAPGLAWQWTPADGTLQVESASLTPPTLSGFGPVAGGFALTFGGPSGQTYRVLSSTNLALRLNDWSVLASGAFGAAPVNYTNTSATDPQRFYRVASP